MPIFSFGIIITTVGLILSYLWELYNFTHDYRRSEMLNGIMLFLIINFLFLILYYLQFSLLSYILIYLHIILHGCPHMILIQELLKMYINILQRLSKTKYFN